MGQAFNAVDYKLADGLRYRYEVENCVKEMAGQDVKGKLKTAGVDKVASIKVKEKTVGIRSQSCMRKVKSETTILLLLSAPMNRLFRKKWRISYVS